MLTTVRPLRHDDAEEAARLHKRSFPTFFLSSLGPRFLVEFYRGFLVDPDAVAMVCCDDRGRLTGIAVGTTRPERFFRRLLVRRLPGFVVASLQATLRRPSCAPRLLAAVRYRGGPHGEGGAALLSSICVDPSRQGSGIGAALLRAWTTEAQRRGAATASLTTDADGNDGVNAFYRSQGWRLERTIRTQHGRMMHRYLIALGADK